MKTLSWAVALMAACLVGTLGSCAQASTPATTTTVSSSSTTTTTTTVSTGTTTTTIATGGLSSLKYRDLIATDGGLFAYAVSPVSGTSSPTISKPLVWPFKIAKYETTYELWYTVKTWAEKNGYKFANAGQDGSGSIGQPPSSGSYPVASISWRDAVVWCNAYSEMDGLKPYYLTTDTKAPVRDATTAQAEAAEGDDTSTGYRLPTKLEWYFAASSGGATAYDYAAGASASYTDVAATAAVAVCDPSKIGTSGLKMASVATKAANAFGTFDQSGNAGEWVWDRFTSKSTTRMWKGGSYYYDSSYCQIGYQQELSPSGTLSYLGFRIAANVPKLPPPEVTDLKAVTDSGKIQLTWTEPADTSLLTFHHVDVSWTPDNTGAETYTYSFTGTSSIVKTSPASIMKGGKQPRFNKTVDGTEYTFTVKTVWEDKAANYYTSTGTSIKATSRDAVVGEMGAGGGTIFYINNKVTPAVYYEVAPVEKEVSKKWYALSTLKASAMVTGANIGDGITNTKTILKLSTSDYPYDAALYCNNLTVTNSFGEGIGGWYLPSKEELNLIYTNLHTKGLGGFTSTASSIDENATYYWSSTLSLTSIYSNGGTEAYPYYLDFSTGKFIDEKAPYRSLKVRAIRSYSKS